MRRFLITLILAMLAVSLISGCTAKESGEDGSKVPADTKQAEAMDTTSMDSAIVDTTAAAATQDTGK